MQPTSFWIAVLVMVHVCLTLPTYANLRALLTIAGKRRAVSTSSCPSGCHHHRTSCCHCNCISYCQSHHLRYIFFASTPIVYGLCNHLILLYSFATLSPESAVLPVIEHQLIQLVCLHQQIFSACVSKAALLSQSHQAAATVVACNEKLNGLAAAGISEPEHRCTADIIVWRL